jgi:phytanoyl-CoA hydroxylase
MQRGVCASPRNFQSTKSATPCTILIRCLIVSRANQSWRLSHKHWVTTHRCCWEVVCHQDAMFLYTEPLSVTGFWFALEDATEENGCLWALPGGHKLGLKKRFARCDNGGTKFEIIDDTPFPEQGLVSLEVKQGTLILLHGLLPHLSYANRSSKSRHAYTLHLVDGACFYPAANWLQRSAAFPARGF